MKNKYFLMAALILSTGIAKADTNEHWEAAKAHMQGFGTSLKCTVESVVLTGAYTAAVPPTMIVEALGTTAEVVSGAEENEYYGMTEEAVTRVVVKGVGASNGKSVVNMETCNIVSGVVGTVVNAIGSAFNMLGAILSAPVAVLEGLFGTSNPKSTPAEEYVAEEGSTKSTDKEYDESEDEASDEGGCSTQQEFARDYFGNPCPE